MVAANVEKYQAWQSLPLNLVRCAGTSVAQAGSGDLNVKEVYSSLPLSAVLVTHHQPWSENIKWKIPEIKNS